MTYFNGKELCFLNITTFQGFDSYSLFTFINEVD